MTPIPDGPSKALPGEEVAVTALLAAQLAEFGIALTPELLGEGVRRALADDGRAQILVARERGQPVGLAYLSFHWTLEGGGWVLWVEELYVLPSHRGRGLGAQLLAGALDLARSRGCIAVELEVETRKPRAASLYARTGFKPLERVHWSLPLG